MLPETLAFLLTMAISLSGLPGMPVSELPPITPVSQETMFREVCPVHPHDCYGLQAVYDTDGKRVLYLDTLNTEDSFDNSFLVHELVHVLQYRAYGDTIYAGCAALKRTETQAYAVQNAYLKRQGVFAQVGEGLRFNFMKCED